jgi:hypothetical protein
MPRHEVVDLEEEEDPTGNKVTIDMETARFGTGGRPALYRAITLL